MDGSTQYLELTNTVDEQISRIWSKFQDTFDIIIVIARHKMHSLGQMELC